RLGRRPGEPAARAAGLDAAGADRRACRHGLRPCLRLAGRNRAADAGKDRRVSRMDGDVSGRLQAGMAATGGEGPFLLRGLRAVHAPALGARLEPCALDDLAEGAARFLGRGEGLPMLVGAVPYDRAAPGAL